MTPLDANEIEALRAGGARLRPLLDYFKSEGYTLAGIARLVEETDRNIPEALASRCTGAKEFPILQIDEGYAVGIGRLGLAARVLVFAGGLLMAMPGGGELGLSHL